MMKLSTIIGILIVLTGCAASVSLMTSSTESQQERDAIEQSKQVEQLDKSTAIRLPAPAPAPVYGQTPAPKIASMPAALPHKSEAIGNPNSVKKIKPNAEKIADDIMSQLEPASMVFTVDPKRSNISGQISVAMLIDLTKTEQELRAIANQAEITTSAQVNVSKVVIARVVAPNFNVVAVTPEEQPISSSSVTQWQWELIPLATGKHQIHVTVNAEVSVNGVSKVRNIETFRETIEIEITPWQVAKGWVSQYWQWLLGTLIIPLIRWLWKRKESD